MHRHVLVLVAGPKRDLWKVRPVDPVGKVLRLEAEAVVLAVAGAAATTVAVEITRPIVAIAMAHIVGLTRVDTGD